MVETEVIMTEPKFDSIEEAIAAAAPPISNAPETTETPADTPPPATTTEPENPVETKPAEHVNTEVSKVAPVSLTDEVRLSAINEILGTNFTNLNDALALKNEFSEIPNYKSKIEELSKLPPKPKFSSPYIEELNNFTAATGIPDSRVLTDLKRYTSTEQKDNIEALVLAEVIKDPSLADDKDMLRLSIQREHNITIDPEADDQAAEAQRVELAKFNLKRAAGTANTLINETMGKVTNYVPETEPDNSKEIQQKMEASQSAWKAAISDNNFKDAFKSIEVEVPLGKTADGTDLGVEKLTLPLSPEMQNLVMQNVQGYVNSGVEFTPENMKMIVGVQQKVMMLENFNSIISSAVSSALAKQELEHTKKVHNPSGLKVETPVENVVKTDVEKQLEEVQNKILGQV